MANGESWQGIPLKGEPFQNPGNEAIKCHYDEIGDLVVDSVGDASDGTPIPDPPAGVKLGPLFHRAHQPDPSTKTPAVRYNPFVPGYVPATGLWQAGVDAQGNAIYGDPPSAQSLAADALFALGTVRAFLIKAAGKK